MAPLESLGKTNTGHNVFELITAHHFAVLQ